MAKTKQQNKQRIAPLEEDYEQWFKKLPATMRESAKELPKKRLIEIMFHLIWQLDICEKRYERAEKSEKIYQKIVQDVAPRDGLAALFSSTPDPINDDKLVSDIKRWYDSFLQRSLSIMALPSRGVEKRQHNAGKKFRDMVDDTVKLMKARRGQRIYKKEIAQYLNEKKHGTYLSLLTLAGKIKEQADEKIKSGS